MKNIYACDFETLTIAPTSVWAAGWCNTQTFEFNYCETLDDFMLRWEKSTSTRLVFHNLAFDGKFILAWLFRNGFTHVQRFKPKDAKTFTTLIDGRGKFFSISICFSVKGRVKYGIEIWDSAKLFPGFSIESIAKAFGTPMLKGHIDYDRHNTPCEITEEEVEYLHNDCEILARALHASSEMGLDKMTVGGNALNMYKNMIGDKFDKLFPQLAMPEYLYIRESYKGGYCYLNPEHANQIIRNGKVYDVNSLYPSVMHDCEMPFGEPKAYSGRYKKDVAYPLYVQRFSCNFELKEGYLPTIQIKNNMSRFKPTQYLTSSHGEPVTLTLTSVDLDLFLEHYEVSDIVWHDGFKFRSSCNLFKEYIDYWTEKKIQAGREGNKAMRTLAKLMLNNLYGKFATRPDGDVKVPYFADDKVHYKLTIGEDRDTLYIPVATFCTAWARNKTIRAAQKLMFEKDSNGKSRFIYADTDSLHITETHTPATLEEIDDFKLGYWANELNFTAAKYLHAKCYIEQTEERYVLPKDKWESPKGRKRLLTVTCGGMPPNVKKQVDFGNFHFGSTFEGKLMPKEVEGGVVLEETSFTIQL